MGRTVICPHCGADSEPENCRAAHCPVCGGDFAIDGQDYQDVQFVSCHDGYHCWQAQPTAYHTIYHCRSYPQTCDVCIRANKAFCFAGEIDVRTPVRAVIGKPEARQ